MEPSSDRFRTALSILTDLFKANGIDWAVADAVAANYYRDQVRTTMDLDVILSRTDRKVDVVTEALHQHGWTSIQVVTDWLIRAEHPSAGRLDVLVSGTENEVAAIGRVKQVALDRNHIYKTLAVEDVIILKLIIDRFQDKADVESIPARRPELDWIYMTQWINEFKLEEPLQRFENAALSNRGINEKITREFGHRSSQPQ